MKPTEEQIKKFWEHWGFYKEEYPEPDIKWLYRSPDHTYISFRGYPPIDLNNLFKWAVPKLFTWSLGKGWELCSDTEIRATGKVEAHVQLIGFNNKEFIGDASDEDPALALFWAIYKVIEEEK